MSTIIYYLNASAKLKSTRKVSYQCENCGGEFSYLFTKESLKYSDSTTAYKSNLTESQLKLQEKVYKKAKNDLDGDIDLLNSSNNYGHEKCPGCGYTQSWMIGQAWAAATDPQTNKIVKIILAISVFFIAGGIFIIVNGQYVVLLCVSSFILWLIIGFLIARFGSKNKVFDPNENFEKVDRKNTPVVVWSDPELVNDETDN